MPNVTDGLRVIYLDLLDLEAVRLLAQVGVCEFEGKPPLQPMSPFPVSQATTCCGAKIFCLPVFTK